MVLIPEIVDAVAHPGARRRRHRPRSPDGRRDGARRAGRVVRLGVAHDRGGRDPPGGEGEVPGRDVGRHDPLAVAAPASPPACCGRHGPTSGSATTRPTRSACRCSRSSSTEAQRRIARAAYTKGSGAEKLANYFVGQIVGTMNEPKSAAQVVIDMIEEFIESVESLANKQLRTYTERSAGVPRGQQRHDRLPLPEHRDVAVLRHLQHRQRMVRQRLRGRGARALVLAVGAAEDRTVGEQSAVAVEDRRPVEFPEAGERLGIEIAARR